MVMKLKDSQIIFRALADETRFRILNLLCEGELCVCDIMRVLAQPQSKVSRHLAYLRSAKLVEAKKDGLWMYYRLSKLNSKTFQAIFTALRNGRSDFEQLKNDFHKFRKEKNCLVACCK
jgi:ArsR family transcriptional regulator, arsenate/arsenite/antimonite-responsive transcriptional repressor